ncbi:MAG: hypothetical protein V4610_06590 [Pseudomonadota bacterium]
MSAGSSVGVLAVVADESVGAVVVVLSGAGAGVVASGAGFAGCWLIGSAAGAVVVGGLLGGTCCAVAGRAVASVAPAMAVLKILIFMAVILSVLGPCAQGHGAGL